MIGVDTTFLIQLEIVELPLHTAAHALLRREVLDAGAELALAPQILAEFLHIVTDSKRFSQPLTMPRALARAQFWWDASEVRHVYPTAASSQQFLNWIAQHRLGRKRLLDTQLASTLWMTGVRTLITSNAKDFELFGFKIIAP